MAHSNPLTPTIFLFPHQESEMVILYVLQGDNGKRYVGITNDLPRRLAEHRSGHSKTTPPHESA
jgi:hypothetical protein